MGGFCPSSSRRIFFVKYFKNGIDVEVKRRSGTVKVVGELVILIRGDRYLIISCIYC